MSIDLVVFDLDAVADVEDGSAFEVFGMTPALRRLRRRAVKIAVATGRSRAAAHRALHRLGWLGGELVGACTTADDAPRAPDMVPAAMSALGVRDARRVAKVSGTPLGLLEGAAAGCAVLVGVRDRGYDEHLLRGAPCTHVAPTAALVPELLERLAR